MASKLRSRMSSWATWRPSPGVVGVLITLTVAYLIIAFAHQDQFVVEHLALHPRRALGPEPWQLFTNALVHFQFVGLISSAVGIWFFGTPVEQRGGRGYMLKVLVGSTLTASIASAALGWLIMPSAILAGASAAAIGCIAAFGKRYGNQPVLLFGVQPVRAVMIAYIFLGIWGVSYLLDRSWLALAGGAAAAAWGAWGADLSLPGLRGGWDRFRLWRLRRRYKVIAGGRSGKRYLN